MKLDEQEWREFLSNPAQWPDDGTYEAAESLNEAVDSGRYDHEEG